MTVDYAQMRDLLQRMHGAQERVGQHLSAVVGERGDPPVTLEGAKKSFVLSYSLITLLYCMAQSISG